MSLPPFISQNFGANKMDRVEEAYNLCMRFVHGLAVTCFWCILCATSGLIASAFAEEQEVAELIQLFLWIVPLGYGLQGVIILSNSSLMPCTSRWQH